MEVFGALEGELQGDVAGGVVYVALLKRLGAILGPVQMQLVAGLVVIVHDEREMISREERAALVDDIID